MLSGPPVQAVSVTGDLLDLDLDVESGEALELLADHVGLEPALPLEGHVLEVAASAPARAGEAARRFDPVGGGRQHLDRVAAPEAVALGAVRDLDDDPLPRQGVPHEHHSLLVGDPGDAVAPVRDRPDLDLEPLADKRPAACRPGPRMPVHSPTWRFELLPSTRPRRTSPAFSQVSSRSTRSRAIWEERSW